MRFRSSLVLVGIFIALCAAYGGMVWLQQHQQHRQELRKQLFEFSPDDIRKVSVRQEAGDAVVGERQDGGSWTITAPQPIQANPVVWNRVAKALADLSNEKTVAETPDDLTKYDLDEPALTIEAEIATGEAVRAWFGAVDPTQQFRYAQLDNGPVFLVDTDAYHELDRSPLLLRDRAVFETGDEGFTRIEFARIRPLPEGSEPDPAAPPEMAKGEASVSVVLQRDPGGVWNILEPVEGRANQELAGQLNAELQFTQGDNYIDEPEDLGDYLLDPPGAKVTVMTGPDSPRQTLCFGGIQDDGGEGLAYVKREGRPSVFTIGAHVWNLFPDTVDGFRENRLLTRTPGDIRTVRYVRGTTDATLSLDSEAGWRLAKPTEEACDQAEVSSFIGILASITGTTFFDEAKPEFGLDTPSIEITLKFADDEQPAHIVVGAATPEGDAYYVVQDTGVITTIKRVDVNRLSLDMFDLRTKKLLDFDKDEAVRVRLSIDDIDYVFERATEKWRITAPPNRIWESQSDMQALLKSLATVTAVGMETRGTPQDLASFGLDAPVITVEVTTASEDDATPDAERTHPPLRIGNPWQDNSQQRFGLTPSRPGVVRIEQSVVDGIRDALKGVREQEP